jgi:chorismate synthase
LHIRPLTGIEECRQVAALEREIWSFPDAEDVVPPAVLVVSVKRGGILLGAFDDAGSMQGFVYSMPSVKNGHLAQWSHMLGILPEARGSGLGARLKLAQRDAALQAGIELIEWTFDPMQALNAHFNFAKLGIVAEVYEEDVYGSSSSPLHAGTPTDRLIAEWHIVRPHVARRLASWGRPMFRDQSVAGAILVNASAAGQRWPSPGLANLDVDERRVLVEIPVGFTEMLIEEPALALAWRLHTREVFGAYFSRGYRAVDFFLSTEAGRGHYLLAATHRF